MALADPGFCRERLIGILVGVGFLVEARSLFLRG